MFLSHIPIKCDNTSSINLTKNPIQYSRTKHIDIRHHFIRDHVLNGDITSEFVDSKNQFANNFTKSCVKIDLISLRENKECSMDLIHNCMISCSFIV